MAMQLPQDVPIEDWSRGWLVFTCASILEEPQFLFMYDEEKRKRGWPVTMDEMRDFIRKDREKDNK